MKFYQSETNREITNAIIAAILLIAGYMVAFILPQINHEPLFVGSFIIGGYYKAKEGILETIENKKLNVELLMVIAALVSIFQGHFEEAAILIIIFAVSGALETYTEAKSERELESLVKLQPNEARVIENGIEKIVDVKQLKKGDIVKILAGEKISADGIILENKTNIDEAMLTGENLPIFKTIGEDVFAGTINIDGPIIIKVTKETKENTISKIIKLIEKSKSEKPEIQNKIERIENFYVYGVLIGAFIIYLIFKDAAKAATFLVIASPCAVVASVMPVVLGSVANLAKQGLIVKSGKKVIQVSKLKNIYFDKTGTITDGRHRISKINGTYDQTDWNTIATIETNSTHPLAQAILEYMPYQNIKLNSIHEKAGFGLEARNESNDLYHVGSKKYIQEVTGQEILETIHLNSNIFVAKNEKMLISIETIDEIRKNAMEVIREFEQSNIRTHIISGDDQSNVDKVNTLVNASSALGNLLPDQKITQLKLKRNEGETAMVGDGINDGPVIAASDIGIAMGSGADVALETADIIITKSNFAKLAKLLRISKKSNQIINQNLIFASIIIFILVFINFFATINLPLAVVSHEGSTIIVILNSLRILKYER